MLSPVVKAVLQETELSNEDIDTLISTENLLSLLKVSLFIDSSEVYFSLCSLITFAKNSSSPSKKVRKSARFDLFAKIAYETFPIKNLTNIKLSHIEVATGLQSLSERWNKYSFDELLSLVYILDVNSNGTMSSEDFEIFTDMVDNSIAANPASHMTALTKLYENLRDKLFLTAGVNDSNDSSVNSILRRKILVVANQARYLQQEPLTALVVMLEENRRCSNDALIEFIENLAAFVKQHISERLVMSAESSVNSSRRGSIGSSSSRRGSIDCYNLTGEGIGESNVSRLVDERESNYSPGAGDIFKEEEEEVGISFTIRDTSDAAHTTGDSDDDVEIKIETEERKTEVEAVRLSPLDNISSSVISPSSSSSSSSSSPLKVDQPSSDRSQQSEGAPPPSTLNTQAAVDTILYLSSPHESVELAPVGTISPDRSHPEDINSSLIQSPSKENLLRSLNTFRQQALAISTSLERQESQLQSSTDIWSDLQRMEAELRAAQQLFKQGEGRKEDEQDSLRARIGSIVITEHQNVSLNSLSAASSTETPSAPSTRPTSPSFSSSRFFSQPASDGSAIVGGKAKTLEELLQGQQLVNSARISGGRQVGVADISSSPTKQNPSSPSPPQTQTPQNHKMASQQQAGLVTPAKTPQSAAKRRNNTPLFQEPPARINMNIFKSPIKRQAHGNKNTYNREQVGWQRTKPLTNKFNERFQTTADIQIANKTNAVFYSAN